MNGKSRPMIDQIRQMHAQKHSIKKVALALNISRNTVRKYLRQLEADTPSVTVPAIVRTPQVDWDYALKERALGRPVKRIHEELGIAMSYENFSRLLKARDVKPVIAAVRLHHEFGEKTQVDYADGLKIIDARTGIGMKTQFFCGVLPASSYTFGEFTMSQKLADFIRSHERMWQYFEGTTKYVVLDNLKSGVTRAHRYDPELNPTYCDYANHAGFAALPARVRTPRDKAAVEATIGVIQRDFFDRHRHTKFYSLYELNLAFKLFLEDFNGRVMADYGSSRKERFAIESPTLQPNCDSQYEMFEWKTAKVHPDSCIEFQRSVYSVPYAHIHKTVHVKFSDKMVIILNETASETIATHVRMPRFKHSINDAHLPPSKLQMTSFDILRVEKFAASIGDKTKDYVAWQFTLEQHPLRALRRMQGLMRFFETKKISKEAMEFAAVRSMQFQKRQLSYFEGCALTFSANGSNLHLAQPPKRESAHIHLQN